MSDITKLIKDIEEGNPDAAGQLFLTVYEELKRMAANKMAAERPDHTLQATALVHEAYLRLVGGGKAPKWSSRSHFFVAAAEAMRRILIESARRKHRLKRGGKGRRLSVDQLDISATVEMRPEILLDIDSGISRLAEDDPEVAEFVKLRLFAGLSVIEAGAMLGM